MGKIEDIVFNHFIDSSDFNGIYIGKLFENSNLNEEQFLAEIETLIRNETISLQFVNLSGNPSIIRLRNYDIETQLRQLKKHRLNDICVYPSQAYLAENRDVSSFNDRPYSQLLALGEAQLKPIFFELNVLERYFNDPRYEFVFRDYSGEIYISHDFYESDDMAEKDKVFLQTFGLGYAESGKRVVAVFLRYLRNLSAEHQTFWKTKEITTKCKILEEYYKNKVLGAWTTSYSVYTAFIEELKLINILSEKIGKPKLFHKTFEENRPKEFTFFLSPTKKNYENFIHTLDKMLSDNISIKFFEGDIELFEFRDLGNGVAERKNKNTIRLLEEWLKDNVKELNDDDFREFINPFRQIRKERNPLAHSIREDAYDEKYNQQQTDIMMRVYNSLYSLRVILSEHPEVKDFSVPKWLDEGQIKPF